FKLFQQIGRSIRRSGMEPREMMQGAVDAFGWHFGIDRCLILILDEREHEVAIQAEYRRDNLKPLGDLKYQLLTNSEWYSLLLEGKPIPMTEIQPDYSQANQELG